MFDYLVGKKHVGIDKIMVKHELLLLMGLLY